MTFESKIRSIESNPNLWTLGSIAAPSDVELHGWKCFDLTPPGKSTARHFLGRNGLSPSVYTSAPVNKFDPVKGVGEATEGAVIRLAGLPSCDSLDAPGYIQDVSDDVVELMKKRKS